MLEVIKCKAKGFIISIYAMVDTETNFLKHRDVGEEAKNRSCEVVLCKDFSIMKHLFLMT